MHRQPAGSGLQEAPIRNANEILQTVSAEILQQVAAMKLSGSAATI